MMIIRLISLYLIHLFLVISFFPAFYNKRPFIINEIPLDKYQHHFNSSNDPIWVAQMSDLHISPIYNESLQRVNNTFQYITANIDPSYLLLTGDITDNLDEESVFSPAYPHEDHFKLYKSIREHSKIQNDRLIEILGNHDTWGRLNFDHYYQYFVNGDKMKENFYVQTYEKENLRVISFCPVHFPTGHTTYHFIVPIYREMLDALESALEAPTKSKYTIFSMHFTLGMIFPLDLVRSSRTKRSFKKIVGDPKYNVVAMLNGHTHPKRIEWLHYGSTIELTSTALLMSDGFQIFSIDNGRINYKTFYQNDTKPAMITSPTPDKIATRIFNDNEFQVRVVSFNSMAKKFSISIDGQNFGDLKFDRKIDNFSSLYSLKVHVESGHHQISVDGDLIDSFNFSVSQKVGPFSEVKFSPLNGPVMIIWLLIFTVYQIIVLCIAFCPFKMQSASLFCSFLIRNENAKSVYLGPVVIGLLFRKLPKSQKLLLLFVTLYPYFFPIGIEIIEGKVGVWNVYGVWVDGRTTYDVVSQLFALVYVACVASGFQHLFILKMFRKDWSFIIDWIYNIGLIVFGNIFWVKYGDDRHMTNIQRITIQFHIIPVLMFILLFVLPIKDRKVNQSDKKEN